MLSNDERSLRARIGAHARLATHDARELTDAARQGFLKRFEREVDPEGELPEAEVRHRRAHHAMSAHMARLALRGAQRRREQAEARRETDLDALIAAVSSEAPGPEAAR